ncbi:helix-turn-helix transcriptional regulator [Flavobacterium sp.]|uniref:helix-turn-helix domain-containing protein n=1 Tax=Flavobacterium sp. TaxID=239 RepID=UPI0025D5DCCF|nr:helix-turn-helix transcriptional regulator [Flavobacterium sp.]
MLYAIRLRKIREAYGLTQYEVAYKSDMTPSAYGQIERNAGNCTIKTMEKIANSIGISLPFLLDINNQNFIEKNKL